MKVLAPLGLHSKAETHLRDEGASWTEVPAEATVVWARSGVKLGADELAAMPQLRLIAIPGSGFDHVNIEAAHARGILICRMPDAVATSAAELTMGLLLSAVRNIHKAPTHLAAAGWDRQTFMGSELAGKTLGIIGLGRIGSRVARRALAFDMRVSACDPFLDPRRFQELAVEACPLKDLLSACDVVSLHTPLTTETRSLINEQTLALMKPGSLLVNAARGELIDESALLRALDSGHLQFYAADVAATEPLPSGHPFRTHPKILLTPHIGAQTKEAQARAHQELAYEVVAFFKEGKNPRNLVS